MASSTHADGDLLHPIVLVGDGVPSTVPSAKVVWSVVLLATVCTAAAFLMLFTLVGEIGPVRATTITYVNPAVAVAAGASSWTSR